MSIRYEPDVIVDRATRAAAEARPVFGEFFLAKFLGLTIGYDDEARTTSVRLPYAAHLCNPQGSMHGGVIATVLDISMGHQCHHFLSTAVTIEMQQRFLRPVTADATATGAFVSEGRRIVQLRSELRDDDGRLLCYGVGSWFRTDGST